MKRLAATSVVGLGLILALWARTGHGGAAAGAGLSAGWVLMPAFLLLSLRWPRARYGVAIPAAMVSIAVLAVCLSDAGASLPERLGWWQICAGLLLGGALGGWFWFRWLPVPASLNDPFSPGRWALIAVHVALIVTGMVLVALQ